MTANSGRLPPKDGVAGGSRRVLKVVLRILATVAIVAPLGWLWQGSRVPGAYSVMDMGYLDYGGGAARDAGGGHGGHMQGHVHHSEPSRLITDLVVDPARPADVRVDLITQQQMLTIAGAADPFRDSPSTAHHPARRSALPKVS
jgi:hypothetical protein